MLVPTQCYATFSRSFNPQVLVGASSKVLSARAVAVPTAASLSPRQHAPGSCTQGCCSHHPGRSYSSLAGNHAKGGNALVHAKGCACSSCGGGGALSLLHGPGCACTSCGGVLRAAMSTLATTSGSRPHLKGCGCASCGRSMAASRSSASPHGMLCACTSCRARSLVTTAAASASSRSHSGDCACSSCSTPHASSCACPACSTQTSARLSLRSSHSLGCACAGCGGTTGARLSGGRAYSSMASATTAKHDTHCGCSACATISVP
jgi:hypothetical protein